MKILGHDELECVMRDGSAPRGPPMFGEWEPGNRVELRAAG